MSVGAVYYADKLVLTFESVDGSNWAAIIVISFGAVYYVVQGSGVQRLS